MKTESKNKTQKSRDTAIREPETTQRKEKEDHKSEEHLELPEQPPTKGAENDTILPMKTRDETMRSKMIKTPENKTILKKKYTAEDVSRRQLDARSLIYAAMVSRRWLTLCRSDLVLREKVRAELRRQRNARMFPTPVRVLRSSDNFGRVNVQRTIQAVLEPSKFYLIYA
ncbi:hypothetical protein C0J52_27929 [Blattella germanica]|nr:hypothetical protein C0J52_27929 [Blattella germanica]